MYPSLGDSRQQIVQVVTSDAAGQAKQQQLDGIQLLLHALKDPRGTEISRACACALLGQLALLTETEIVPEEVASSKCKLSPEELKVPFDVASRCDCPLDQRYPVGRPFLFSLRCSVVILRSKRFWNCFTATLMLLYCLSVRSQIPHVIRTAVAIKNYKAYVRPPVQKLYEDDEDFDASEFQTRTTERTRTVAVRETIFLAGAVDPMIESLYEVTDLMIRLCPPDMPTAVQRGCGRSPSKAEVYFIHQLAEQCVCTVHWHTVLHLLHARLHSQIQDMSGSSKAIVDCSHTRSQAACQATE